MHERNRERSIDSLNPTVSALRNILSDFSGLYMQVFFICTTLFLFNLKTMFFPAGYFTRADGLLQRVQRGASHGD